MSRWTALPLLLLLACSPQAETPPPAEQPSAAAPAASEVVYLDVRSPEEFASGHVAGAVNVPHDQVAARWRELAAYRDRPMVVYCRTGRRSGLAIDVLREHGFSRLENGGGLDRLAAQGLPVER